MITRHDCPRCDGTGHVPDEDRYSPLCPDCGGEGTIEDESQYVPRSEEMRGTVAVWLYGRSPTSNEDRYE